MKAIKGNREYTIAANEKDRYVQQGFDIFDDKGKLLAHGKGKTVSLAEYEALQAENAKLKAEATKLKKG